MKIAATLGKEEFAKFQQTFNFGLKTNVDLAGEARTASLLFPVDQMGSADLATNSFGQNFNDPDDHGILFPDQRRLLL